MRGADTVTGIEGPCHTAVNLLFYNLCCVGTARRSRRRPAGDLPVAFLSGDGPSASISLAIEKGLHIMAWIILVLAGLFEVVWAVGLKYTEGFTRLVPSAVTLVGMLISFWLLSLAMKTLPLGTAYAIWVGIGAIGAFVAGLVLFHEALSPMRVISVLLIAAGLIGLKLSS
ncbi:Guanidinium exporter [Bordetella muralis]